MRNQMVHDRGSLQDMLTNRIYLKSVLREKKPMVRTVYDNIIVHGSVICLAGVCFASGK